MKKNLFLVFLVALDLSAAMTVMKKGSYTALLHQVACAASEQEAISAADRGLKERSGIDSIYLFSENVYVRHAKNSRGEFCVEGILTQKGLALFDAELAEMHESIMGKIEDLNDGLSFAQKPKELKVLAAAVAAYNNKIRLAEKIAPLRSQRIDLNMADLETMINAVPVVDFIVNGETKRLIVEGRLFFTCSVQDDSPDLIYRWEFGDGSSSIDKNPEHIYTKAGNYTVSLEVIDNGKKSAVARKNVIIAAKPKPKPKEKLVARFSTEKMIYTTGEAVRFNNDSSSRTSTHLEYEWDFGDGSTSRLAYPEHSYNKTGLFRVRLEVTNMNGLTDVLESEIRIVDPAIRFAKNGVSFESVVHAFGEPEEAVVHEGASTQAYQYGGDWILVKYNKVECRIKGEGFKTNLMGNAKGCNWYEKNRKSALYDLEV